MAAREGNGTAALHALKHVWRCCALAQQVRCSANIKLGPVTMFKMHTPLFIQVLMQADSDDNDGTKSHRAPAEPSADAAAPTVSATPGGAHHGARPSLGCHSCRPGLRISQQLGHLRCTCTYSVHNFLRQWLAKLWNCMCLYGVSMSQNQHAGRAHLDPPSFGHIE